MPLVPEYTGPDPFISTKPKHPIWENIKCLLMTPVVVVRAVAATCTLITATLVCTVSQTKLVKDTRCLTHLTNLLQNSCIRTLLFTVGFHYIPTTGTPEDCGIIIANHCSYVDMLKIIVDTSCAGLTKKENRDIPLFGTVLEANNCLFVDRHTPEGRQKTLDDLLARSASKTKPLLIFPQGTTSNGSCLTGFKKGAFIAGQPVQPVCIRYTSSQADLYLSTKPLWYYVWWSMCQFYNKVEYDYLPVYTPSDEEKNDPQLYANNVQRLMAAHMKIPTSNHTYADIRLRNEAIKTGVTVDFTVQDAKDATGLTYDSIVEHMVSFSKQDVPTQSFRQYLSCLSESKKLI